MLLQPHQRILFVGDSITDCGRGRPVGDAPWERLGNGYVSLVNAMLTANHPELHVRVSNVGSSGDTVRHLKARWQTDVLDQPSDWVSIMIGTNDIWRQFDCANIPSEHVLAEEYQETLDELASVVVKQGRKLILATPFMVDINPEDSFMKQVRAYSGIVKALAEKHDAKFVDTQAAFDSALKHLHSYELAGDRVHPNSVGHMILANAFYKALKD